MSHVTLRSFASVAVAGLLACGGSDPNTQPQVPSQTTTTSAPSYVEPSSQPNGISPVERSTSAPTDGANSLGPVTAGQPMSSADRAGQAGSNGMATGPGSPDQSVAAGATSDTPGAAAPQPLNDDQIAAALDAANRGEIEQARFVAKKTKNKAVKQFAEMMIQDHRSAESALTAADAKAGVSLRESAASDEVKAKGEHVMLTLRSAGAADLDKTYVDAQVDEHVKVLDLIDRSIPQARSADLKKYLQDTRSTVAQHLRHATDLQSSLAK